MAPSLFSLLSLLLLLPFSAPSSPPAQDSHFTKHRLRRDSTHPPQQSVEVTSPIPFTSLTPACTCHVLSHSFAHTIGLPPTNASYFAPSNCTWSRAVLHLSGSSNGTQDDRIAALWLDGAEILRTSIPEPTSSGVFWNVRKDVTKYSSLLRQSNITLSVMLQNVVDDRFTGVYQLNISFLYYDVLQNNNATKALNFPLSLRPSIRRSTTGNLRDIPVPRRLKSYWDLNDDPADLIIPMSAIGDEGYWFKIDRESDVIYQGFQIPLNTYRAVIEVYVSPHGNDEFWYTNPPDSYIDKNNLPTQRGNGAFRELFLKLDNDVIGSVIPFPVIYPGGINPLFWEPVVAIGAFDLPSYEIELTPLLGMLLDGKVHFIGLGVTDAISYWLVNANLHLKLDDKVDMVQAGTVEYSPPKTDIEREEEFGKLDGEFEIEGEAKSVFAGWVNSTAGNFTTYVTHKVEIDNTIKFTKSGTHKKVKHEAKVTDEMTVRSSSGQTISKAQIERKYPLEVETTTLPGTTKDTYLVTTKLDHSVKEEKTVDNFKSKLQNRQKSEGWMFVLDGDVLSGAATTEQRYVEKVSSVCYSRSVSAARGLITIDSTSSSCSSSV